MSIPLTSRYVAVIGAGAAGLAAARELSREGHKVVVYERDAQIGGTWVYNPRVEPDPLSLDPGRPIIQSSLYSSLRTNLPREAMGFGDYPFIPKNDKMRDPRRFPGHREVLFYLRDFAREFEIEQLVRFETEVVYVGLMEDSNKWKVRSKRKKCDNFGNSDVNFEYDEEIFDAVVVCNGHFTEPRVAEIAGISAWPGKQVHSHNYRVPEPFRDQVVVLIGNAASAMDISRDIAVVAKEVHVASRSVVDETHEEQPGYDNMWRHSMIQSVHEDGSVVFRNGRVVLADTILHCTGYKYHFPFLETHGIVTVDDNRVGPLYKHVFPPVLAPWLSFVGLPWKVLPFRMFEFQSKWIAGVLSGRIVLPSQEEMMKDIEAFYLSLEASNISKRYTHDMSVSQCGFEELEEWRTEMFFAALKNLLLNPEKYRDEWEDDNLILEAIQDFTECNLRT
ncbi:flavin-containing monooxygenase FMO GS-OX-like 4 isoform X2 [Jatropha curcas]|uniref:flavin-containing monooxygenase FMO GS-OX-like 4 isoform X2 n=1 Tax=Jatropha curcas TaxID=180498 RepID=UPI0009D75001|nr:flavin-containing monooxygenase FMO GS-OX-like 4 isoform X2 [Jatropha curcas]